MIRSFAAALAAALPVAFPPQDQSVRLLTADVDGDGLVDVLRLEADGTRLARNLGGGRFAEPVPLAGPATDALWLDLDQDGDVDLLLCEPAGLRLYENRGGCAFVAVESPTAARAARRASALDLDGDRLPDLHVVLATGEVLLQNLGGLAFAPVQEVGDTSAATLGAAVGGATAVGGLAAAAPSSLCAGSIYDMAVGGCITASSLATIGELYPLSLDFNVRPSTGFVGMGTASPADRLHVVGVVRAQAGLRFGDGSLQTSAFDKQWNSLAGVPAGFVDGIDNDTLYAAGLGLELVGSVFGFDQVFGDGRYWNESQALGGDLSGNLASAVVDGLQGRPVASTTPGNGQVLKWNGSTWAPAADTDTNTTYTAGTALALAGSTFSVTPGGVGPTQLANDGASLSRVTGGTAQMTGGALRVNTSSTAGRLNVGHSSATGNPQLNLVEQGGSTFSRMQFSHLASPASWTVAGGLTADADGDRLNFFHSSAGDVLSISGQSRVGVRTLNPLTALHVAGSLHLQGTGQDISVQSGEQIQLGHYDGTTFTERLRIDGAGKLHAAGSLAVGGALTVPATSRWVSLSGADFLPTLPTTVVTANALGCFVESAAAVPPLAFLRAVAPLHLPDGAQVNEVLVHFDDTSGSINATVELRRKPVGVVDFPLTMAQVNSSGSSGFQVRKTTSITQATISNEDYVYFIAFDALKPADLGQMGMHEVAVRYTITTPLP